MEWKTFTCDMHNIDSLKVWFDSLLNIAYIIVHVSKALGDVCGAMTSRLHFHLVKNLCMNISLGCWWMQWMFALATNFIDYVYVFHQVIIGCGWKIIHFQCFFGKNGETFIEKNWIDKESHFACERWKVEFRDSWKFYILCR